MNKKLLYLIPARKNSKRIPNKNLLLIKGKPLVAHSIETALASKFPDKKIVVTTDSEEIGKIAENYSVNYIPRPPEISGDTSRDIEFISHALSELQKTGYVPDFIVHLRPTTPFRDITLVDNIIQQLIESDADAIRTIEKVKVLPEKCVYVGEDGFLKDYFNRNLEEINHPSQFFKTSYTANGIVDVLKNHDFTRKEGTYQGLKVIGYITREGKTLDIDDFDDLKKYGFS